MGGAAAFDGRGVGCAELRRFYAERVGLARFSSRGEVFARFAPRREFAVVLMVRRGIIFLTYILV